MVVFGFHAIEAMIAADKPVRSIFIMSRDGSRDRIDSLKGKAKAGKISIREFKPNERPIFEQEFKRAGGKAEDLEATQGVFAQVPDFSYAELGDLLRQAKEKEAHPILLFLDSITDPQNVGNILRSAAFFGVSGLVIPEHRSSPITPVALKISSGGFAHVPVCRGGNLVHALEEAKEAGFWVAGLSEHATESMDSVRFDAPIALVVGNEEKGIRPLTAKNCDYLISLPAHGNLLSLNAATAAAVALALVRQKQSAPSK